MRRPALTLVVLLVAAISAFAQTAQRITLEEFRPLHSAKKVLVVDVRDPQSFANGHIPGAINVPLGSEQEVEHLQKLKDAAGKRPIVTYCA